ncbi:hypothetical protein EMIT0194MI4_50372 [Pseudomonas sp. IT-194MI4]
MEKRIQTLMRPHYLVTTNQKRPPPAASGSVNSISRQATPLHTTTKKNKNRKNSDELNRYKNNQQPVRQFF